MCDIYMKRTNQDLLFLYQELSKAAKAFTILIDEAYRVQLHTETLPNYVTPQIENTLLAQYLPPALFASIQQQILAQKEHRKTSSSESTTFIYTHFFILVNISIQQIEHDGIVCFAITITEINRNSEHPLRDSSDKQIQEYRQENAALAQGLGHTKEALQIVLKEFERISQEMEVANTRFLEITNKLNTRTKEAENREHFIQRITDISPGVIYVYDLTTQKNVFSSGSIGTMLDYSETEVLAMGDQVLPQLILPEDFPKAIEHHTTLAKLKDDSYKILEYRMRSKKGRVRWYSSYDKIFERNEEGFPTKIIGIAQDITEQKNVLIEVERINDELKRFSYAASHDLKEPLNTITTIIELLPDMLGEVSEEAQEFLSMLDGSTTRMRRLITDLLDYALLENEKISFESLDLNQLVAEVKNDLHDAIKRTNATLTSTVLPTLSANAAQLKRLFQNLISNALKYHAPNRTPYIDISAEKKQGYWLFSIRDNGIGIAEENQAKIFQVFQKLHSSREYEGTGIGLASCQRIIENHQGEIGVRSILGEGSTFYFSIPMDL